MSVSPALKSWLSNPVYHMELGYTSGGNSEILFFKKTNKLRPWHHNPSILMYLVHLYRVQVGWDWNVFLWEKWKTN